MRSKNGSTTDFVHFTAGAHLRAGVEVMSAEQAASWGLINAVVDADALRATAYDRARALAKLPADAVQRTKRLMKQGVEQWVMRQFASEQQSMVETVTSPAAKDAFARFLQRR